jgi:hypothetical protein
MFTIDQDHVKARGQRNSLIISTEISHPRFIAGQRRIWGNKWRILLHEKEKLHKRKEPRGNRANV